MMQFISWGIAIGILALVGWNVYKEIKGKNEN